MRLWRTKSSHDPSDRRSHRRAAQRSDQNGSGRGAVITSAEYVEDRAASCRTDHRADERSLTAYF